MIRIINSTKKEQICKQCGLIIPKKSKAKKIDEWMGAYGIKICDYYHDACLEYKP